MELWVSKNCFHNEAVKTVVLKFGGASVSSPERFSRIAEITAKRRAQYDQVVCVISAMGDTTNELQELALKVNADPPQREFDMLISVGERISASLLAMALEKIGIPAISFTGSQAGIMTTAAHSDAEIIDVRPTRLMRHLAEGRVIVVAGFQGVSAEGDPEITTLGRGGSDTTAVALAKALGASHVEFFKDVRGFYSSDPKTDPDAKFMAELSYDDAIALVRDGAKILSARCLDHAKRDGIRLHLHCFLEDTETPGSVIS